jgi:hypothetical protein
VASRRPNHAGPLAGGGQSAAGLAALVGKLAFHVPHAANDNKAPFLLRLRRLVFLATAGLAVGWLFWVGLLR